MKKRIAAAFAALALVIGSIFVAAPAEAKKDTGWDWKYGVHAKKDTGWDW